MENRFQGQVDCRREVIRDRKVGKVGGGEMVRPRRRVAGEKSLHVKFIVLYSVLTLLAIYNTRRIQTKSLKSRLLHTFIIQGSTKFILNII